MHNFGTYLSFVVFFVLLACETKDRIKHYERLIGTWEVMNIEARAEKVELEDVLESKKFEFNSRGQFWQGELQDGIKGKWKIIGDQIMLVQPEIRDLSENIIYPETHQLWEVTLSDEWMIWRGTHQNDTQHLKILFQKQPNSH